MGLTADLAVRPGKFELQIGLLTFMQINPEIISMVIPQVREEQMSVTGIIMCTSNCYLPRGLNLPRKSVVR